MNAPPAPRPNLLPTAAFVSLLVLAFGAAALFALSFTNRQSGLALERLGRFHTAQLTAFEARVNFKTQVQEWKNVLLRSRSLVDRQTYRQRFQASATAVAKDLASLPDQLTALGIDAAPARQLVEEHQKLGAAYDRALASFQPESSEGPFATDAEVRGIDRKLNDELDQLAHRIEQAEDAEFKSFGATAAERYALLRRVTLGVGAVTMLAAFWLVFQVRRAG